jgi:hypothetical protein
VAEAAGGGLVATYLDQSDVVTTFALEDAGAGVAHLSAPVTSKPGAAALCVAGPGLSGSYPASMTASSGTMTAAASGTVFFELRGTFSADAGMCGSVTSPGYLWILCEGGPVAKPAPAVATTAFQAGGYTCSSDAETYYDYQGQKQFVTAGGPNGKLVLSELGGAATVEYTGDKFVDGTLHFDATTATTALAGGGQALVAPCYVPAGTGSVTPETLPISFASLVLDGSTLFVAYAGTMPPASSCAGARKAGVLICTKD